MKQTSVEQNPDQLVLDRLCRQVERKRHATTYLFTGNELERKKVLALAFARALNCEKVSFATGCDCKSCGKIEAGTHPDVKWYGLDEEANSIKISEVRDFKNWLGLKPFEGRTKVFIFNQAERLTAEAQNALLKSLEEPPVGNVIIFLVPNRKSLFDTIVSRAMEVKVPIYPSDVIREVLVRDGIPKEEAEFLSRMSQGELVRAREAHEKKWFQEKNDWMTGLVKSPISFLDQFQGEERSELGRVFDFLVEWVRDLAVFRATLDPKNLIHADQAHLIESVTSRHALDDVLELFEALSRIRKSIDDYANQKLALTEAEILLERFFKS